MKADTVTEVSRGVTPRDLGRVVAGLSRQLDSARVGSGPLAELRRIGHHHLPPEFWRLYLTSVPPEWRERDGRPDSGLDMAWAGLVRAMVEMEPHPHSFERSLGSALGDSGYSESRFVRLLRAAGRRLARELRVAGEWLARAGVPAVNWSRPATLLINARLPNLPSPRSVRHLLARDYFRATTNQQSAS